MKHITGLKLLRQPMPLYKIRWRVFWLTYIFASVIHGSAIRPASYVVMRFWWNLDVWRPDAWAHFVEIGVVKLYYAAYLFACSSYCRREAEIVHVVWFRASQAPTPLSQNRVLGIRRITAHWTFWFHGGVEIKNMHYFDETWMTLCHCGTTK